MPAKPAPINVQKAPAGPVASAGSKANRFVQTIRNLVIKRKTDKKAPSSPAPSTASPPANPQPAKTLLPPTRSNLAGKKWYRRPAGITGIALASAAYIAFNVLLFYRSDLISASLSATPIAKLTAFLSKNPKTNQASKLQRFLADTPPQNDAKGEGKPATEIKSTPVPPFTIDKKITVPLTSDIRDDIPQALDVAINPVSKKSNTYAIQVSARDSVGVKGVTVAIPAEKTTPPKSLAMVKGTPEDGVWETDWTITATGDKVQLVIEVEGAHARTTTEVTIP